ncbi:hypothetical protein CEG41_01255 [Ureaplasma parvum]|nr:hypothetical protein CEG41_01255 [Ureaplasma parvum]
MLRNLLLVKNLMRNKMVVVTIFFIFFEIKLVKNKFINDYFCKKKCNIWYLIIYFSKKTL